MVGGKKIRHFITRKPVTVMKPYSPRWHSLAYQALKNIMRVYACKHCGHPVVGQYCCGHCGSDEP